MTMENIPNNVYKNPEVSQKLKKMFNKPKYSDSVFLVNQTKFHASSHLVSVSCRELETMLDDHFENCGDREVKIGPIKYEDSFSVILKDIYGLEISFTELSKDVLCEVLCLSEQYELTNLFNELKMFISNLDQFEIESVVSLLNTARKYKLTDLYERIKMFSFENSEQLVKHVSFSNLKYDMLLELISSDWFATDEINILTSALTWHSSNINSPDDIEKTMGDKTAEDKIEEIVNKEQMGSQEVISVPAGSPCESPTSDSVHHELTMLGPQGNNEEVLEMFSKKILISLLSNIRLKLISWAEMLTFSNTELYAKFKDYLLDLKYSSPICEARKKFTGITGQMPRVVTGIVDVPSNFTVTWQNYDNMFESNEEHQIGGTKWKLCLIFFNHKKTKSMYSLDVYLKCTSVETCNWECKVECQVKMISLNPELAPTQCLSGGDSFTSLTLTSEKTQGEVGRFYIHDNWYPYFAQNLIFSFEVLFKAIHCNVNTNEHA